VFHQANRLLIIHNHCIGNPAASLIPLHILARGKPMRGFVTRVALTPVIFSTVVHASSIGPGSRVLCCRTIRDSFVAAERRAERRPKVANFSAIAQKCFAWGRTFILRMTLNPGG